MDCLYGKWKYKIIKSTFSYYRIDHIILAFPLYGGIHTWNKSHHMHLSVRVVIVTKSRRSRPPFVDSNLLQASLDDVYFKSENRQDGIMFQTINISFMCILRLKIVWLILPISRNHVKLIHLFVRCGKHAFIEYRICFHFKNSYAFTTDVINN